MHSTVALKSRYLSLAPALLWMAAILWLSLSDDPPQPPEVLSWDKLQHAVAFGLLTLLLGLGLRGFVRPSKVRWPVAAFASTGLGALVELLQKGFTTTRLAEWGDLLADLAGCLAVCLVAFLCLLLSADSSS